MAITKQPKCKTCGRKMASAASIGGRRRYFCANMECTDHFRHIFADEEDKSGKVDDE